ncbi:MAG: hypothetical protein KF724_01855 [Phycisphaeraceae bacterium]|nr:hypothetical protein [Phycisphaeraceae bacterium]
MTKLTTSRSAPRRTRASGRGISAPILRFAVVLSAGLLLGGCYEHVTRAGITSTEVKQKYEPSVEEEGPSWINEFMWGEPPKGEDPVRYYRRKNSFGIQQ